MAGSTGFNGYQICDEDTYDDAVLLCGGHEFVDGVMCAVDEALHRNPFGFRRLRAGSDIFVAKTKLRIFRGVPIPAMTLFFVIDEANRTVRKLHLKYSSPESMAMAQNLWDDDEPPF